MASMLMNHLWQSTLFAAVMGLLALALRNNGAHIRYWLWFMASIKFLVPFTWLYSLGSQLSWRVTPVVIQPQLSLMMDRLAAPVGLSEVNTVAAVGSGAAHPASVSVTTIMLTVWMAGCVALLGWWLVRWVRLRRLVRTAKIIELNFPEKHSLQTKESVALMEPGIVGVFKPVLLMPAGIAAHLETQQLNAILAHELCHVRRHDNLTAAIHMLVEVLFWFHPMVWWIGTRLVEERESACDEAVVGAGHPPQVYAEGILKVCQLYLESPLDCAAGVSGADLKHRIEVIMKQQVRQKLNLAKKVLLAAVSAAVVAGPVLFGVFNTSSAVAQSATGAGSSRFVTTTITTAEPQSIGKSLLIGPDGSFTTRNVALRSLIGFAYNLQDRQIVGPDWINSTAYNIKGMTGAAPVKGVEGVEVYRVLVQSLLLDKFGLAAHRDISEQPVLALVGTTGAGITEARAGEPGPLMRRGPASIAAQGIQMELLTKFLSEMLDQPVLDQTGLTGIYNFNLKWADVPAADPTGQVRMAVPPNPAPEVLTAAVRDQLGLRLEPQTGKVERLVIDKVQRPADAAPAHTEVQVSESILNSYVGSYLMSDGTVVTVSRSGDHLSTQSFPLQGVELYAESDFKFFAKQIDFTIAFDADRSGKALINMTGANINVTRIDDATAAAITRKKDERIKNQTPWPDSEAAVRRLIAELTNGNPNYALLSDDLAAATRKQLPMMQQSFKSLGALQSVTFKEVGLAGRDVYEAKFEKSTLLWRVSMDESVTGKVLSANFGPAQ